MFTRKVLNCIALRAAGDLGPVSMYTDRYGRLTVYPFSPPDKPASALQAAMRSRFTQAVAAWSALSSEEKAAFEAASKIAWLPCTGHNVYVSAALSGEDQAVRTLAAQTGITLPTVPYIHG